MTIVQVIVVILVFNFGFAFGAVWGGHRHE
jgi:hypothetical protein